MTKVGTVEWTVGKTDGWKELKIDDLPSDILVGDYEFQYFGISNGWLRAGKYAAKTERDTLLTCLTRGNTRFRYRKRQEKQPSFAEIRLNHLKSVKDGRFEKEDVYRDTMIDALLFLLESATIPPEAP